VRRPSRFPIHTFAIADFALAALAAVWALAFAGLTAWGVFFAEGERDEVTLGVAGSLLLVVVGLAAAAVFAAAGVGLLRRAPWGYYAHLVAAALVALTCWGIPYTIAAILFAARPEFRAPFSRDGEPRPPHPSRHPIPRRLFAAEGAAHSPSGGSVSGSADAASSSRRSSCT
jgi:hypothetical protein